MANENIINPASTQVEQKQYSTLNLGPTHPATHGIFQNVLTMDGEVIVHSEPTIGYIHRAFEKLAERRPFKAEIPKRVQYLRVIIMELARISDHLICNTVIAVDTGALTGFVYLFQFRELIYEIYEEICGARLTTNIGRIGGFERDFSDKAWAKIDKFLKEYPEALKEFENLVKRNRIFMDRTIGAGPISAERALNYSFSGPNLRAAGVDYDVRVMNPYSSYEDFDFAVPVGLNGDTYDRFMVRQEEMWESMSIIKQAIAKLPDGPYHSPNVPDFYLPPKEDVYNNMEALIYHFKIVMGETDVPKGEVYQCVEGGNGELGFYLISDGGRTPFRLHMRRPCFIYYQAYAEMIKGTNISDAILTMSSMNVIAGELDA
jgi:NADH-quinone oxidoreductase subunit D